MIERLFLFQFPVLLCQFLLELFNLIFLLFALPKLFFNLFRHRFVGSLIFLKRLLPSSIFAADPKELMEQVRASMCVRLAEIKKQK